MNCTFCKATRFDVAQDDGLDEQRALAALGNDRAKGRDALIIKWVEYFLLNPSSFDAELENAINKALKLEK